MYNRLYKTYIRRSVMIYAEYKNSEDKEQLYSELKNAKNKNWYRRLQIVKLSAGKMSVQQLSKIFDLCEAVIRKYTTCANYFD